MSEPKRYDLFVDASLQAEEGGEWVKWEDYADLKAEVEKLRKGDERDMTAAYLYAAEQSKDEIKRLKAEVERLSKKEDYYHDLLNKYALDDMRLTAKVERLTKAGDAIISQWNKYGLVEAQLRLDWFAAKSNNLNQPD